MTTFTIQEKNAMRMLQNDLPLTRNPFTEIAVKCGLSAAQLIGLLKKLSGSGILRKFGAILRHQKAGYRKNALVVWSVRPDIMENTGRICASRPYVSHCYERNPAFQGKYNLFTMLHSRDEDLSPVINDLSQSIVCNDFLILQSLQEYKKTSPEYFE